MISKKMEKTINEQINFELYSSYLYLAMRAYFDSNDLPGFANWVYVQALEEFTHADKFYKFLIERGGTPVMKAIDNPDASWKDALEVMQNVYSHEQKVTALIHNIVNIAIEEKDHASNSFMQWFINEQVEEESGVLVIVKKLKMIKSAPQAMFMLDNEMGARTFVPPTAQKGA